MLALKLTFHWGRYYAHPWGLNPARLREAEWPPSPWRLLRALAAGWFRAHPGFTASDDLRAVLNTLGSELPDVGIGPVAFSRTAHWQPNYGAADKDDRASALYKRTPHENHFAATDSPILFRWNRVELSSAERALLERTLPHVTYFGRAESLCRLELLTGGDFAGLRWCRPHLRDDGKPVRRIGEDCRDVFCPDPTDFQADDLWSRRANRGWLEAGCAPTHLVEDLLSSRPLPDGARWITYQMPYGWPGTWVVRVPRSKAPRRRLGEIAPRVAHYLRFSLQCRVPIPLKFTVPVAEQFRGKAIWHFSRIAGENASSFALSGHDKPEVVAGEHQHAFYLPFSGDPNFRSLSDLYVWCLFGFTKDEIDAMMSVDRLDWGSGRFPIRPVLMAISDTPPAEAPIAAGQTSARLWRSVTPFVPPRYFYRGSLHRAHLKEKDSPERQLADCIKLAGIQTGGEIRRLTLARRAQVSIPPLADWDIVRAPQDELGLANGVLTSVHVPKTGAPDRTRRIGIFFEVSFDKPVALPLPALGHSSHFGLGLFTPFTGGAESAPEHA